MPGGHVGIRFVMGLTVSFDPSTTKRRVSVAAGSELKSDGDGHPEPPRENGKTDGLIPYAPLFASGTTLPCSTGAEAQYLAHASINFPRFSNSSPRW
jgi:hypothetical protein